MALIRDLQKTDSFDPFSLECKKIIHNLRNAENFELFEVSTKTSCIATVEIFYYPEKTKVVDERKV